jgi:hypothetical protein
MKFTGLTASTTYNFTPYVTLNGNGTATVNIFGTGTSVPTLAQQVQIVNGDGNVPCSASIFVTAATPASGTGGGTGGGGIHSCFSPNTKIKTQRGDVAIIDLIAGEDKVLTARGTWKAVLQVTLRQYIGPMLDMGEEEFSTLGHPVLIDSKWIRMDELGKFPSVKYAGTIHNIHVHCDLDDDGVDADTEHSYTLANGLMVHNMTAV